jgi:hypothetical protein
MDAFRPGKTVYYYRYEAGEDPPLSFTHNGRQGDTSLINNFASQTHYELVAKPGDPATTRSWVRQDYLLISAGADRLWGFVKEDSQGKPTPAVWRDISTGLAVCDDICNFKH